MRLLDTLWAQNKFLEFIFIFKYTRIKFLMKDKYSIRVNCSNFFLLNDYII